ncbi:hypothetical protein [Frigidibacter sp. ROC022]|uniref:hypothetical protein n=1 Tax=Frigidibacter sp. ROC022 TaxID=2971796 RepID=UPI00215A426A|nr:hypothetical protein [Frigidibacter sp. ROC022]MCR8725449.1 hypothetical protein [Frigidibacter sp. ROC022]
MATEQRNGVTDDQLDAFFRVGREDGAALPEGLFARIMADAEAEATRPGSVALASAAPAAETAPRVGLLAGLLAAIGGWPAMAGMASAAMAGLWLGFASPSTLDGVIGFGSEYTVGDFMPSLDLAEDG